MLRRVEVVVPLLLKPGKTHGKDLNPSCGTQQVLVTLMEIND